MDITERAARLLATMEPSVSGSNGHSALFAATAAVTIGFDLQDLEALAILQRDFNPRCKPQWSEKDLLHKIRQVRLHCKESPGYLLGRDKSSAKRSTPVAGPEAPAAERIKKRQDYQPSALQSMMMRGFNPDFHWLAERSPWDPRRVTPQGFLDAIFQPGEKTVLFTRFASQGQLGHVAGAPGKTYYLGDRPGPRPTICEEFPTTAREGMWFLPSPLDGKWYPTGATCKVTGNPVLSRRSGASITTWRHLLLESDNAPEADWLNCLTQLPLPITALYTSGSRSIHALVKIDAASKSAFDAFRDRITPLLSRLGADPAAISGVRLTRLPGVLREGTVDKDGRYVRFDPPRLQRLLYLNPSPEVSALRLMPRLRTIHAE